MTTYAVKKRNETFCAGMAGNSGIFVLSLQISCWGTNGRLVICRTRFHDAAWVIFGGVWQSGRDKYITKEIQMIAARFMLAVISLSSLVTGCATGKGGGDTGSDPETPTTGITYNLPETRVLLEVTLNLE